MNKQKLKEWRHKSLLDFWEEARWLSLICAVMSLLFAICMPFLDALKFFLIVNGTFNGLAAVVGLIASLTSKPDYDWEIGAH